MLKILRFLPILVFLAVSGQVRAQSQVCDVDVDGDVDINDIGLILAARNTLASGPDDPRDADGDGFITVLDARACVLQCTLPGCEEPAANTPPVSDAGPDSTANIGDTVTLDGSGSFDADGDPLTFSWQIVLAPTGSAATLSDPAAVMPTFVPDQAGDYIIELVVNDGTADSAPDDVVVVTVPANTAPVADAGPDQSAFVGDTVTLDGAGSFDVDGDALTFFWTLSSVPAGSAAALSDPGAVMPEFVVDVAGTYVAELIVDDGEAGSFPDTVVVTTLNTSPVADAGPDQSVPLFATVNLDGSGSFDADGDALSYSWALTAVPAGSSAAFDDSTSVTPTFVADEAGTYVAQLVVNDGAVDSPPDTVVVTTENTRPVADAGPDQVAQVGDTVQVDGSGSFDADGDGLTFAWSFTSVPTGSTASFDDPSFITASFVADIDGLFVAQLIVNDGQLDSDPDTTTVFIQVVPNTEPAVDAGPDTSIDEGDTFTSTGLFIDPDADTWTATVDYGDGSGPQALPLNTDKTFAFDNVYADNGVYVVIVTVTDDEGGVGSDTATVTVVNVAPTVDAGPDGAIDEGDTFLSAGSFTDPGNDTWTATVDYGDGDGPQTLPLNPDGTFALSNLYPNDGTFDVIVTVTDDDGGVGTDTATVVVGAVNAAPVLDTIGDQSIDEDATLSFTATATDADTGDVLTFSLDAGAPTGAGIDPVTGAFSWAPEEADGPGTFTITVRVTDDGTPTLDDAETITITVDEVNQAPALAAIGDQTIEQESTLNFTASATDADVPANALTFSLDATSVTNGMSIDPVTGLFSWTPTLAQGPGDFAVTVTVTDDGTPTLADSETITVSVTEQPNNAPVLDPIGDQTVDEEATLSFIATASDTDTGDALTFSLDAGAPTGATIDPVTGEFSWTPTEDQGPDDVTITIRVTDDATPSLDDSETISVTVNEVNVAPELAAIGDQSVDELATLSFTATATDVDLPANALTFSLDAAAVSDGMSIDPTTGVFSWTPSEDQGPDTFTVTVTVRDDGTPALDDSETITITVNEVNDAPILAGIGNQSVDELVELSFTASATDSDVPANALTFSLDAGAPAGSSIDPTSGLFSWTPTEADGGNDFTVTVRVTDDGTPVLDDSETFTITVNEVNEAPTADAGPDQTVLITDTVQLDGSGSSDPESDPLTYAWTAISGPGGSTVSFNDDTLENPTATFSDVGTYVLQLIVSDQSQPSAPDTVTIVVDPAPAINIFSTSVSEGDSGTVSMDFTVSISFAVNRVVSVDFATSDGTATAGSDYVAANGTVTFPANTTASQTISIDVNGDTDVEPNETFDVLLSNPVNATLGNPAATGTIINDDTAATITLSPPSTNLFTGDVGTIQVTLSNPAAAGGQIVNLLSDDTSIATVPASITIPESTTAASFQVTAGNVGGTAVITASAAGFSSGTASVVVSARAMSIVLDSALVGVGRTINGIVTLAQPAPTSGVDVTLSSLNNGIATVSPSLVTIPGGASTASLIVTGVAAGTVDIAANAPGFSQALDTVTVTSSLISIGAIPDVAPGQSFSLPISITDPAPGGGLVVTLTSSDPSIATIDPSVFITAGQLTPAANPQVTGVLIGTTQILATAPSFAPDTRDVIVTLNMVFTPDPLDVIESDTVNITLNLSAPAPAGGLSISLAMDDPGTATAPTNVTVLQGQTSATIPVTGESVGSTVLRANAPGIAEATATINVDPAPPINVTTTLIVGDDLQTSTNPTLGAPAPAGNLVVTFTSADPARLLLAPDATTPGTASVTRQYNAGSTTAGSIYVHGLDDTGTVDIIASAPGYATSTGNVTLVPSGFTWLSGNLATTTFSNPSNLFMRSVRLAPGTFNFAQEQAVRAGLNVDVVVINSDPGVGTFSSPVQFVGGGTSRPFGTFDPLNAGTTDLTIIQPVGFDVPANQNATITATVSAPLINFADSTVGDDLQLNVSASLAQAPPVATDVTFTVADLSVAVISTNPATPGGADITILGVTGTGLGSITVQGLQQGSTTITVTAAGYQTRVATVTVVPSGFSWLSGDLATTTFSNPSTLSMRSVRLAPGTLNFVQEQSVRAGLNVDVVVTNSDTNVGTVTSPYLFTGGGTSRPAGTFDPLNAGTADLTIIQPVGFDVPANQNATITATVSAPLINFADPIVGDDLQLEVIASLAQAPPVATDVMFTVGDPSVAVISTNPATPGGADITIPGVTNTGLGNITVQGLQQGNTTITVTAAGYQTRVATVTVDPSGFSWLSGDLATTTFSNPSNLFMRSVRLAPGTLNFAGEQPVRAGLNVNVVVTNSDTNVGTITSPYLFTGGGTSRPSGTFDPLTAGTTDLTIIQPAGFDIPSNQAQTISATVDAPDITISGNLVVGLDLQMNTNISLQVAPPSPTDVTITVASGTIATISDDGLVEGSASITIPNVSGTLVCNCLIQGRSLGSTLITAQAGGYNDGTNNVTVDPSGFTFPFTSSITTTAGGGNTSIQMRSSRLNPVTLNRVNDQSVRGGLTVSVNVSNSNPTAGTLTVNPVVFTPNTFLQTTQFDPDAAGVTIINIQTPPGFSTPSNAQQIDVTVNP